MSERPGVRLLDGTAEGLDAAGLRARARAETEERLRARAGALCVSRSYRHPYALVAWHAAPVGVDLERVGPCDDAFADVICTPDERAAVPADAARRDAWLTALWSGKEALTKALGDAVAYDPSRIDGPSGWPGGRSGVWRAERVEQVPAGYVGWVVWRER